MSITGRSGFQYFSLFTAESLCQDISYETRDITSDVRQDIFGCNLLISEQILIVPHQWPGENILASEDKMEAPNVNRDGRFLAFNE